MIDGSFRENTFGARYFSEQDFPDDEFEVIWVEFYSSVPESVTNVDKVKVIKLGNPPETTYHSSYCFNAGIKAAQGELIVIPDADQIVERNFISKLWDKHQEYDKQVIYAYRYDERKEGELESHDIEVLREKCKLKNPINYGGCLSVRKKWLEAINGYEQHEIFSTGFHANGLDVYTRFKNFGLAIRWDPDLRMYHPWHPFTLAAADSYKVQMKVIDWRARNLQYMAKEGMDASRNVDGFDGDAMRKAVDEQQKKYKKPGLVTRVMNRLK